MACPGASRVQEIFPCRTERLSDDMATATNEGTRSLGGTAMKLGLSALVCGVLGCGLVLGAHSARRVLGAPTREILVSPSPTGAPVIAAALEAAPPGSTIRLRKGLYRETVTITKPVSLVGDEGAVLDPSEAFQPQWQPRPELGKGAYRAASERAPRSLLLDGKILAALDERRTGREGPWFWKTLLASGTPLGGFRFIRGLWIYRGDEKALYVHLENDADPAPRRWTVVWEPVATIAFRNATDASVRGLTLAHGYHGVSLADGSRRCSVSGCVIGPWEKNGVNLESGATECLVEKNEVFRGAYEEWTPVDTSKERYEVWQLHKLAGYYDRVGISLVRCGAGNRVHANHVYETFDGINLGDSSVESLDIPLTRPDDGRDTEIWENVIERTRDSGMEFGAGCINVKVHHNVLRKTHGGLRFKVPRIGPIFIYRNVLFDGTPFNIWYSMDDSPAEGYIYHNTIVGGSAGLIYSSFNKPHGIGAPRWHYLNNLVLTQHGFFENWRTNAPVNFTVDYNIVVGGGKPYADDPARDQHSRYLTSLPLTTGFPPKPLPGSAAVDAGLDLSTYLNGKPLPGCEAGYFKGKAPDIGAHEIE
jgi:Right handed beta helix region